MADPGHSDERPHRGRAGGRRMEPATILLGVPLLATIGVAVIRASRHLSWDWPTHAHHHLLGHIATAVGLAVVSLLVVRGPLRAGEPWAWWALAVAGLAIFGGFWLGNVTVGFGEPAAQAYTAQAVLSAVYVSGLAVSWPRRAERRAGSAARGARQASAVAG